MLVLSRQQCACITTPIVMKPEMHAHYTNLCFDLEGTSTHHFEKFCVPFTWKIYVSTKVTWKQVF